MILRFIAGFLTVVFNVTVIPAMCCCCFFLGTILWALALVAEIVQFFQAGIVGDDFNMLLFLNVIQGVPLVTYWTYEKIFNKEIYII